MDYKVEALRDKVYKDFILGKYGVPKIPSKNEVIRKIEEMTSLDYVPLTTKDRLTELDIEQIREKFSNIIDDLDVLFDSVEAESKDVLDQLTNALKEHNGVKRELRRIRTRTNDIVNGKLGEEYLFYNFTESFDDLESVNDLRSDQVNTDAGLFTIKNDGGNLLTLSHYIGKKLEFNIIEAYSEIVEYGYVGSVDAASILTKSDPRELLYRVKTINPSRLRVVVPIQLKPDGRAECINSVSVSLDSGTTKGYIRLYYQNGYQWKDVPSFSFQEIKGDSVQFSFPNIEATHIKFEFIKDSPDIPETNEFYISLSEVSIGLASTKRSAVLYSKPIEVTNYENETVVVHSLSCSIDADIPDECGLKVYVAQDIVISGQFVDASNSSVPADSVEAVNFNPSLSGTVFLSDIWAQGASMTGLAPYKNMDFGWLELKPGESFGDVVPQVIKFDNTSKKLPFDNSLFSFDSYLFGDAGYTGPWPQYTGLYGTAFISGWCNENNDHWDALLSGMVGSGLLVSGIDVATKLGIAYEDIENSIGSINTGILGDADYSGQWLGYGNGYPLNYYAANAGRVFRFGDYSVSVNGWWRPYTEAITSTGVAPEYIDLTTGDYFNTSIPDFYFNGIQFFRIYKFGYTERVIDPSVRLYTYQERPVGSNSDYYPHNFVWNYKTSWAVETATLVNRTDPVHELSPTFDGYSLSLPTLQDNEEYIGEGVVEVRRHKTNFVLSSDDYVVTFVDGTPDGVSLAPLTTNFPYLTPTGLAFDVTYNYRIKNRYASTWVGYAIVSPGVGDDIIIRNPKIWNKKDFDIIGSVTIEDLDRGGVIVAEEGDGLIRFNLDASDSTSNRHFKITMNCASDEETGFSARYASPQGLNWIPSESRGFITIPAGIRIVPRLEPIKVVDLSTLIYDTPMTNDRRCAITEESSGEKYLVVKSPSKDVFPGYYFNSIERVYETNPYVFIENKSHYIRRTATNESGDVYFTTGSSGSLVVDPWLQTDTTWNNGQTLGEYPNTVSTVYYTNHTTYGYPVNIDDSSSLVWYDVLYSGDLDLRCPDIASGRVGSPEWTGWIGATEYSDNLNEYLSTPSYLGYKRCQVRGDSITNKGYLFYNTGENLPAYYSISYRTIQQESDINSRFLYKLELTSDGSRRVAPRVRSIRFKVNGE